MNKGFYSKRGSRKKREEHEKLVFIAVEGETEQLYFQELCNELKIRAEVEIVFKDSDLLNSVKFVQENAKGFQHKWCVFDIISEDEKEQFKRFKEGIKLAKKYKIPLAVSVPDFEIWFYFHFSSSTASLNKEHLHKELRKFIPNYTKAKSYHDLLYPKCEEALTNCKKIRKHLQTSHFDKEFINPSSGVDELVEFLFELAKIDKTPGG